MTKEYKVKFSAKAKGLVGLFAPGGESVEVYQADTAKEALALCQAEFKSTLGIYANEVNFHIIDVEQL